MGLSVITNSAINDEKKLLDKEYIIYIQPKVNLATKNIAGGEALIRQVQDDGTIVMPSQFIDSFEKSKLIKFIDLLVIEKVCEFQKQCMINGLPLKPISCNLSKVGFLDKGYVECICNIVDFYGISHGLIEFEITESTFMNHKTTIKIVKQFKKEGFRVSVDDFGKGYSCLSILQRGLFDYIKIDKGFLHGNNNQDINIILSHIIDMAHQLGIQTVCEGIETESQLHMMEALHCDVVQGFLYSKPLPVDSYELFLSAS